MEKYYRFAGVELTISIPDHLMYDNDRTLAPFAVDAVENPHRFEFQIVDRITVPCGRCMVENDGYRIYEEGEWAVRYIGAVRNSWENAYIRVAHRGYEHCVQLKKSQYQERIGVHTVLSAIGAEHLIARALGFVFHCSYIERNGCAILFTAPSGTGKSTQADLWHQHRNVEIINGDRAAIRLVDDMLVAEGIPFAGSSQYCKNKSLPIAAIVYLQQASKTSIRKMRGYEAFARIWEGVSVNTWNRRDMESVSGVVQQLTRMVPIYCLECTPDESAVLALEQALESRESYE